MKIFVTVIVAAVIFAGLDALWFTFFMKQFAAKELTVYIGGNSSFRIVPAIITYLIMGLGITLFVLPHTKSFITAGMWGALFGFVMYGVFDLTNLSLLSGWTVMFAIFDILWGIVASAVVSVILFAL